MIAEWHDETEDPTERGWYEVERPDNFRYVRAWGDGLWWIPLTDGWLSGIPPDFKWRGPVAPLGNDPNRSPFEECIEIETRLGIHR